MPDKRIAVDGDVVVVLREMERAGDWSARVRIADELAALESDFAERGLGPTRYARLLELRARRDRGVERWQRMGWSGSYRP